MVLLSTSFLIFRTQLVRIVRTRKALVCTLLASVPVFVGWIAAIGSRGQISPAELATNVGWSLYLQAIVPLLALVAGTAVVSDEVEDRTITYLFTRPIPRAALFFGRWSATMLCLGAMLFVATFAFLAAAGRAAGSGGELAPEIAKSLYLGVICGAVAYSALFAALGVFVRHPMIVGLVYTFAIEGFFANLPGQSQLITVQYYVRSLVVGVGGDVWRRVETFSSADLASVTTASGALAGIGLGALLLGAWIVRRKEFVLPS